VMREPLLVKLESIGKEANILEVAIFRSVPPFRTGLCRWTHCEDKNELFLV